MVFKVSVPSRGSTFLYYMEKIEEIINNYVSVPSRGSTFLY